jgi:steroid delta-isomerase
MSDEPVLLHVLHEHVERFNAGVRTGDFGPMLERFAHDAELSFASVPVGPFRGRQAIEAAYRDNPPDDEVVVLGSEERRGNVLVARYAWSRDPGTPAGEMRFTIRAGAIERLVVTFDSFS